MINIKLHLPELLIIVFLLITYVFSFYEKLSDWKGTIAFIKGSFDGTPIKKAIPILIGFLLFFELIISVILLTGLYFIIIKNLTEYALLGCVLSCLCVLYMLIGQRIAKDYVGSTSLGVYFIISVLGVFMLS